MPSKIETVSDIGDENLEKRMLERAHKASEKTRIKCKGLIMFRFETWKNAHEKGQDMVIQGTKIPTPVGPSGLPSTLMTKNGIIFFCKDIPGARYSEPSEAKMAHELLHEDYDERSLGNYTEKLVQEIGQKNKRMATWLNMALEGFINMNIDGYVTCLYGSTYENEILSYCKTWIKTLTDSRLIEFCKKNNRARMYSLFEGCEFYARVPSHEEELLHAIEPLCKNAREFSKVLLVGTLYRQSYEKGKKGIKAKTEDLKKFNQAIGTK